MDNKSKHIDLHKLTGLFREDSGHPKLMKYLRNDFEYELYAEFKIPETSWYFGGFIQFSDTFRKLIYFLPQKINRIFPFNSVRMLIGWIESRYSLVEIIYFCKTIQKFITWNKNNNYRYINLYKVKFEINQDSIDALSIFFYQLETFINFLSYNDFNDTAQSVDLKTGVFVNKNLEQSEKIGDNLEEDFDEKLTADKLVDERLLDDKIESIKKIIAFLNDRNPVNNLRFTTVGNFKLIQSYTIDLVRSGKFTKPKTTIAHIAIDKYSIVHTYYLINKVVNPTHRLPHFFTFLVSVFDDLKSYAEDVKIDWKKNTLYKKYSEEPKFYEKNNPYAIIIKKLLEISDPH